MYYPGETLSLEPSKSGIKIIIVTLLGIAKIRKLMPINKGMANSFGHCIEHYVASKIMSIYINM